jgi:hypothetical protein
MSEQCVKIDATRHQYELIRLGLKHLATFKPFSLGHGLSMVDTVTATQLAAAFIDTVNQYHPDIGNAADAEIGMRYNFLSN